MNSFDFQAFAPQLLANFQLDGQAQKIAPIGDGHIHASYRIFNTYTAAPDYLLQAINTAVFPEVAKLQENIALVTTFLQKKYQNASSPTFETLQLIPTVSNKTYYEASNGCYWRIYVYKKHLHSITITQTSAQVFEIGRGFGQFLYDLNDFPLAQLHTTLPHFHSLSQRWLQFQEALQKDVANRKMSCHKECDFVATFYQKMRAIEQAEQQNAFPIRLTHNDTKCNNILLDKNGKARCVIDLDTVMPGCLLYDFGDGLRSTMSTAAEDCPDYQSIQLDEKHIEAFAKAYLSCTAPLLHNSEKDYLPQAIPLLPFIIGLRFLTDFLAGDIYFKSIYPTHNLIRAKAQLQLSRLAMQEENQFRKLLKKYYSV